MALYKDGSHLTQSTDAAFDKTFSPGEAAPYAGIYRCTNCGDEISIAGGHTLPPQNHAQHTTNLPIKWKMIVHSQSKS